MAASKTNFRAPLQFTLGLGLAALFFYMLAPFLLPMIVGAIIALLSYPLFVFMARRIPRSLAGLITTLAIMVGVLLPLTLVTYNVIYQVSGSIKRIKIPTEEGSLTKLVEHPSLLGLIEKVGKYVPIDKDWLKSQALAVGQAALEGVSAFVGHFLAGIPSLAFAFFLTLLSMYFFLIDGPAFLKFLRGISPMTEHRSDELYSTFERTCRGVVLGLFASGFVQALVMTILLLATGVPNAVFFGFATFLVSMIPLFGSTPVTAGAVIYLMANGRYVSAIVMSVGGVIIGLSDNFVRPWVMKGSAEMHPLLALVSAFGAISLIGAAGIFIGPLIAAVFVSFLHIYSQENAKEGRA